MKRVEIVTGGRDGGPAGGLASRRSRRRVGRLAGGMVREQQAQEGLRVRYVQEKLSYTRWCKDMSLWRSTR